MLQILLTDIATDVEGRLSEKRSTAC
jgi:hypothetical protein